MHRRLRLERAAIAIVETRAPITRIAFEAGCETHESFTRAFRDSYAVSPSEFRDAGANPPTSWTLMTKAMLASPTGIHINSQPEVTPHFPEREEPNMKVAVENYLEKRVFAVAHRGPYNAISEAFAQLHGIAQTGGLPPAQSFELIAIYHDDPETTAPADLRADSGVVVSETVKLPKGLHEIRLKGGLYGKTLHQGPYDRLGDTWSRLMEPGCLAYAAFQSIRDPDEFFVHSKWRSRDAFEEHAGHAHTVTFLSTVEQLVDHEVKVALTEQLP